MPLPVPLPVPDPGVRSDTNAVGSAAFHVARISTRVDGRQVARGALIGSLLVATAACSDDPPHLCTAADWGVVEHHRCRHAITIGLIETPDVVPSDMLVQSIDAMLVRAREESCWLERAGAMYWRGDPIRPTVRSTHPPIVAAWEQGIVVTGDPDVDALFAEAGLIAVEPYPYRDVDDGYAIDWYAVTFEVPVSLDRLQAGMAALPATGFTEPLGESWGEGYPDLFRSRVDGGWQVSFRIGWGDCFVGCQTRTWVVEVTDDLMSAEIVDEYGYPVPSQLRPCDGPRPGALDHRDY